MPQAINWRTLLILALILMSAIFVRFHVNDVSRQVSSGTDETAYWYAAQSLIKHDTLTSDRDGNVYRSMGDVKPTLSVSPGFPVYLSLLTRTFGPNTTVVFVFNILLSVGTLLLLFLIIRQLDISDNIALIFTALASIYPGSVYNLDRILTETLFVFLLASFVYASLLGMRSQRARDFAIAGFILAVATHVRPIALPFLLVAVTFFVITSPKEKWFRSSAAFLIAYVIAMSPWWIRNFITFDQVALLSQGGENPKVWGAVPYYLDMNLASGSLADVIRDNSISNPEVYRNWRVFGYLNYMWGKVWDENLVYPSALIRWPLLLHWIVVVPSVVALPFLIWKRDARALFVLTIPLVISVINIRYHGLPRYAYPAVPFCFVIAALAVNSIGNRKHARVSTALESSWQRLIDSTVRMGLFALSIVVSIAVAYSVFVFGFNISEQQSRFKVSKNVGISLEDVIAAQPVLSEKIALKDEQLSGLRRVDGNRFENTGDGYSIIRVPVKIGGTGVNVTKVTMKIRGGFPVDSMTVYWRRNAEEGLDDRDFFQFPINAFQSEKTVYMPGDVGFLIIVPGVTRGMTYEIDGVDVSKYRVQGKIPTR